MQLKEISDGKYRYCLYSDKFDHNGKTLIVIQKNPSLADCNRSDPTAGKIIKWAKERKFSKIIFLNLFSYRSPKTDIFGIYDYETLIGSKTDIYLKEILSENPNATIVAAWGNNPKSFSKDEYDKRVKEVVDIIGKDRLQIVGKITKKGYPRHGLSWNEKPELEKYSKFL